MMKKTLMAMGLLALAGSAAAQSQVQIFGVIDMAVTRLSGSGDTRFGLSTGGANISRLGFRGTEDLGGGLKAGFWLEAGMDPDVGGGKGTGGGLTFNRRSTVSLMGNFGEVRLGRDDSATFLSTLIFDPFLTNGVGQTMAFTMLGIPGVATAAGGAPIQISNAISYFLPKEMGGFYGQLQFAPGERASGPQQGKYAGTRLGYQKGALNVALATGKLWGDQPVNDLKASNVGASYDLGVVKPMLLWATEKRGDLKVTAIQLGAVMPMGASEFKASIGHYDTAHSNADWSKLGLGYGYNFSKRTQAYVNVGYVKNKSGANKSIGVQGLAAPGTTLGGSSNGIDLGVRHFF